MRLKFIVAATLISCLLQSSLSPSFNALWLNNRDLQLNWSNWPSDVCIDRKPLLGAGVFIGCYPPNGSITLPPKPPSDHNYFPQKGDQYILTYNLTQHIYATWHYRIYIAKVSK